MERRKELRAACDADPFKDQTHSVNEGKSNFVTSENQTAVLSGSNRSIMTHRFHPPIVHQFEIFYDSSTLRPVQLRSKLTSTSIEVDFDKNNFWADILNAHSTLRYGRGPGLHGTQVGMLSSYLIGWEHTETKKIGFWQVIFDFGDFRVFFHDFCQKNLEISKKM